MPESPPNPAEIARLLKDPEVLDRLSRAFVRGEITVLPGGRWLHWDELRRRQPPDGLDPRAWWAGVHALRVGVRQTLPLLDKSGSPVAYATPDPVLKLLHELDCEAGGTAFLPEDVRGGEGRDRFLVGSLIEEAITSSQLEGAATTRAAAKAMLRNRRTPRTPDERMIWNNFQALRHLREQAPERLTPEFVLELHRILMEGGELAPEETGDYRRRPVHVVYGGFEDVVVHEPPRHEELEARMEALCRFANGEVPDHYVHPLVRAVILHFQLAYDHPFVDGSGRTARAIFYWSVLRSGYRLLEYVSLSDIVKRAPAKYALAFLHTETDENDLTYFLIHQIECLRRAVGVLKEHLARKREQLAAARKRLGDYVDRLNHRQLALLSHALKHPEAEYTVQSHRTSHGVVLQTARGDLLELVELGLLTRRMRKKQAVFRPAERLGRRLEALGRRAAEEGGK